MPIAASTKTVAAVVIPTTPPASRRIAPAPRKPMPWTMFDAIRVLPVSPNRRAISPDRMVNKAVARQTKRLVRTPAGRRRRSRSMPMSAPNAAATVSRKIMSPRETIASRTHSRLNGILAIYNLNCVNFAKWRALACISLRFKWRSRSRPNFSTVKLPSTDP